MDVTLYTLDAVGMVTGLKESGVRCNLNPENLRPAPPDVVTLTLSYRGHEVSEEMDVDAWRAWTQSTEVYAIARAARALAEKVDGKENHDG